MKTKVLTVIWGLAAVALLAGLVLTIRSFATFPQRSEWIGNKVEALHGIESIAASARGVEAAFAALEELPEREPVRLAQIAEDAGIAADISYGDPEPLLAAWSIRRGRAVFEKVPAAQLARFMALAENQRPPWRVAACEIYALPGRPGNVRATLSFEGLVK